MRIIHIYDGHERVFPGQGSVPTIVYKIAKYVAKKGHDVLVLERRWDGLKYEEEIDGIEFKRIDVKIGSNIPYREVPYDEVRKPHGVLRLISSRSEFAFKVKKILEKEEFDVIHAHLPFAANVLVTINRKLGEKMIYTAHIGEEKKRFNLNSSAPLLLKLFSPDIYLMRRVRKSTVLNENLKVMLTLKGIESRKLEVIPNGVEVREFGSYSKNELERIKERYRIAGKIIIMFAGTITPRKGVEVLVKAAEIVLRQGYRDVVFLFCGNLQIDKEFVKKIMNYIKNHGLEDYMRFTGFISYEDLKALYSACDVFVLPSFEEGFGLVLTEAMASGKPLIGSNIGGIPMQIKEGWNGFLFEPGDYKQLAEKIAHLLENEEERKRMGRNSRKLAEEEFDWSKIAEKYAEVYKEVVEG